jgi:hypothetical protein
MNRRITGRFIRYLALGVACVVVLPCRALSAESVYESASLGAIGYTYLEGTVPWRGSVINPDVYTGVVFELAAPVTTTRIGGHFVRRQIASADFFGAMIKLTGPNDLPDSYDFSTPDVLGTTLLSFPTTSSQVFGDLSLRLDSGWYALVFASGYFGANGAGASVISGADYGSPRYIGWVDQTNPILRQWSYLSNYFDGQRFVVEGRIVPEPAFLSMCIAGFLSLACGSRARRR